MRSIQINRGRLLQVLRFAVVGGVGFVVDGGLLWLLITNEVSYYVARIISFPIAVCVTWWLNRQWTFHGADRARPAAQARRYFMVQIVGALANYLVFLAVIAIFGQTPLNAMIGFFFGSLLGMLVNYFGAQRLVYID